MPDSRRGGVLSGDRAGDAARGADEIDARERASDGGADGSGGVAGSADGPGAEAEAGQPGRRLVRRRHTHEPLPHPARGGAAPEADRAYGLARGRGRAGGRASDLSGRGRSGLWRHAVGRQREAGDPGAEGARAGGDAVSLRLHGLSRLSVAGADCGDGWSGGDGRGGGPVRGGRRLGPAPAGVALCQDRGRGGGGRAADRFGDARTDGDARCGRGLCGRGAVADAGG